MPALVSSARGIEPMRIPPRLVQLLRRQAVAHEARHLLVDRRDRAIDVRRADAGAHDQRALDDVRVERAEDVVRHPLPLADAVAEPPADARTGRARCSSARTRSTPGRARAIVVKPYAMSACALFIIGMTTPPPRGRRRAACGSAIGAGRRRPPAAEDARRRVAARAGVDVADDDQPTARPARSARRAGRRRRSRVDRLDDWRSVPFVAPAVRMAVRDRAAPSAPRRRARPGCPRPAGSR